MTLKSILRMRALSFIEGGHSMVMELGSLEVELSMSGLLVSPTG